MAFDRPAPAVALDGIDHHFGHVHALSDVTLHASPGVTGLLGPNGAGKTTLIRMMATVLAPERGGMRLLGLDPADGEQRLEIRRRLGYLPQEAGFYRSFTAFEFVDYVAILKGFTDRRSRHDEVRRVLALVGLDDVRRRRTKDLSGGMRQRLALAQALLGQPDLLVLDEPTAGLDPEQRLRFRELVSQLPNEPVVLLSTHQTDDVTALCERVVVLADGAVRFEGTPAELAATAAGRIWSSDAPDSRALLSWRTGDGRYRHIGDPPGGADDTNPTIDDAYLLMLGTTSVGVGAP